VFIDVQKHVGAAVLQFAVRMQVARPYSNKGEWQRIIPGRLKGPTIAVPVCRQQIEARRKEISFPRMRADGAGKVFGRVGSQQTRTSCFLF
jgi:hypothetical protein